MQARLLEAARHDVLQERERIGEPAVERARVEAPVVAEAVRVLAAAEVPAAEQAAGGIQAVAPESVPVGPSVVWAAAGTQVVNSAAVEPVEGRAAGA